MFAFVEDATRITLARTCTKSEKPATHEDFFELNYCYHIAIWNRKHFKIYLKLIQNNAGLNSLKYHQ